MAKNETREGFEVFAGESQKDGEFCLEINRTRFDEEGYLIDDGHCNIVFEALDLDYFFKRGDCLNINSTEDLLKFIDESIKKTILTEQRLIKITLTVITK